MDEIHFLLQEAYDIYKDEDGYVNVAAAGSYIKRIKPGFDSRTYGYKKLSELLLDFPDRYKSRQKSSGLYYRCVDIPQKEDLKTVHMLLKTAYELYKDETGFAHIGPAGSYVKNNLPKFDYSQHGFKNIPDLLSKFPQLYAIRKENTSLLYRCLK